MDKTDQILSDTSNRYYPLPKRKWKYYQEWHDTLFFHWKVPSVLLEKHLPDGMELDTFDDTAWVSLVAFEIKNMTMRNLPILPYISHFHEINVRTYVIKDGIPGIYLFSIETDKLIEVLFSRLFIGLPYKKSTIIRTKKSLVSENTISNSYSNIEYEKSNTVLEKTELDLWLTERHALYDDCNRSLCRFDIHHKEWKLENLNAKINTIKYKAGQYGLTVAPDRIQYAEKIDVVLWGKKAV